MSQYKLPHCSRVKHAEKSINAINSAKIKHNVARSNKSATSFKLNSVRSRF